MRWQDVVIAMLPSILSKDKPALATSIMNIILVSVIAFCLFTLHLWPAGSIAIAIAGTWAILAIQKQASNKLDGRA